MKIIYFGSTEDSIYTLDVLKQNNFEIFTIFTKNSKSMRRGRETSLTSIENYASEHKINIKKPRSLKSDNDLIAYFSKIKPDIFVVSSYGIIIPKEILEIPKYGINYSPFVATKI